MLGAQAELPLRQQWMQSQGTVQGMPNLWSRQSDLSFSHWYAASVQAKCHCLDKHVTIYLHHRPLHEQHGPLLQKFRTKRVR